MSAMELISFDKKMEFEIKDTATDMTSEESNGETNEEDVSIPAPRPTDGEEANKGLVFTTQMKVAKGRMRRISKVTFKKTT